MFITNLIIFNEWKRFAVQQSTKEPEKLITHFEAFNELFKFKSKFS